MATRRQFLKGGLAAVAYGLSARTGWSALLAPGQPHFPSSGAGPFLNIPRRPPSITIDGLPFESWFTADDFREVIPFHSTPSLPGGQPPPPSECVDVAVVGGGISGLTCAYFLRQFRPVLFELRPRFGGNAMGEIWEHTKYSLGSAYFITPDKGDFLEQFYQELGLDRVARVSEPPDPVEVMDQILDDFYGGQGSPPEHQLAFQRYAEVVTYMADEGYPDIPWPADEKSREYIRELDRKTFKQDLLERMGDVPIPPLLAAAIQGYFYSSFNASWDEVSAASGWNFVAAEEFGRWVLPGGNAYMAEQLYRRLQRVEQHAPQRPLLRANHQVFDVRPAGDGVLLTYIDPQGQVRSLRAKYVVLAGAKQICKYMIPNLEQIDEQKYLAMTNIRTNAYLVVNVLINRRIQRDFYDIFLVHDENFPIDLPLFEANPIVTDVLNGHFARPGNPPRSVLSLYWPLPFPTARFTLVTPGAFDNYTQRLLPQLRRILALLDVPESAVQQVRVSRWGHAMPIAFSNLIADGTIEHLRRPLWDRVFFSNQDNWALPAIENSVLEAQSVTAQIAQALCDRGVRPG
ncbi:protoporphyrinogen oxidase [Phycisphaerae bacterium RAS1]|nr:protoporphyrinogen oxidase [Phycisphaerae bacterium RAS1]